MNASAERDQQLFIESNVEGKDDRDMTARNFAIEAAGSTDSENGNRRTRANHIRRRRWLRMVAALAGIMMLVLQTAPALASGQCWKTIQTGRASAAPATSPTAARSPLRPSR
ncbi:MAG: hypothetical protein R3A46_09945 [Thermomicrobiales bacterium]